MQTLKPELRDLILETCRQAFRANIYEALTMRSIAQKASISTGNLYRYFKSKDDIFMCVLTMEQEKRIKIILKDIEHGENAYKKLEIYGKSYFKYSKNHPEELAYGIRRFYAQGSEGELSPEIKLEQGAIQDRLMNRFHEIIHEGKADGSLRPELDPDTSIKFLTTSLRTAMYQVIITRSEPEPFFYTCLDYALQALAARR